ncbi:glycosyltransferase family 4 protein [Aeromonas caviae]|uniref:glycosyltransferase family 4 protein n=1 Tax=Aeromonas caviae TaxID=648 RepID=UPI001CC48520|nr:glycosyltransferase family 4 protein [Aeromonas caviae]GJB03941.1 glycosyl transferase [Aeromonas caviae]GKR44894.1 glycosyl transferase [Aeromonas caviae]GKR53078.1 glycosyl transferase [Aeromonas caviae]GKR63445.1 glycosyl transferase [Aeromonas caviae]GKR87421.1 glycosyl transferase [Aeromonas caviae]
MIFNTKKIVLVANTSWSVFNFRYGLLNHLLRLGYDLTVIAPHDEFSDKMQEMGCRIIDLPMDAKGINPIEDCKIINILYRYYYNNRPDFIIHYTIKPNIYGSLAAKLAGIPSMAITTGLGYTFANGNIVAKVARLLYKFAFQYPKEVWFLNEDDRQTFLKHRLIADNKAVLLHGEGVDLGYFIPQQKSQSDHTIRFLLIARMLWDKGVGEFVAAARIIKKQYPQATFQLLGACGVANPNAIERAQVALWEKEGVITYLGTTTDVRPMIADADCVVLPSFYSEGIPRTLMEAAAMERPIITTDNVGCRDVVIHGKTGLLCQVKDVNSLAVACEKFIQMSQNDRNGMGRAGRLLMADKFDEKMVIEQYMKALKKYGIL